VEVTVPPCREGDGGLRECLLRRRNMSAIQRHQPGQPLKPKSDWRDYCSAAPFDDEQEVP
jgi:hypothetical protein